MRVKLEGARLWPDFPIFLFHRWESVLSRRGGNVVRSGDMGYSLNQASNACGASVTLAAPLQEQWTLERSSLTSTGGREAFMFLTSIYPYLYVSQVTFSSLLYGTTRIISKGTPVQMSSRLVKRNLNY